MSVEHARKVTLGSELSTNFDGVTTVPASAQAITSITAADPPIYTPTPVGLASGSLTVGDYYKITDRTEQDFTADGAADNNVNTYFTATGTNVTLDADDTVDSHGPATGFQIVSGADEVLGADVNAGFDFTLPWQTAGSVVINDADTFTSTGNGGVWTDLVTDGVRYKLVLAGSIASSDIEIRNSGGDGTEGLIGTGFGTYYFTAGAVATSRPEAIYLRNLGSGQTDITTFTITEVLLITHGETVCLGTWTNGTNSLVVDSGLDMSDASGNITTGYLIPASLTDWTSSDSSALGPQIDAGGDSEQQLANSDFEDTTEGAELVTGTDADFSGAGNWINNGLGTFSVNDDVADKAYLLGNGGADYCYLDALCTVGKCYAVSLKAKRSAGAETTIYVGANISAAGEAVGQSFAITPDGDEDTYTGVFVAAAAPFAIGLNADGFNAISFEIDDVSVKEITLDDWAVGGTRDATSYLVYDTTNDRVQIVSDGDYIGITQVASESQLYYWEVDIQTVDTAGNGLVVTDDLTYTSSALTTTGVHNGFGTTSASQMLLRRLVGASLNITVNSFKIWKIDETYANWNGEATATLTQATILTLGQKTKIYNTLTRSAGTLTPYAGTFAGTAQSASGTYSNYIPCQGDTNLDFAGDSSFVGKITSSDLSVKSVGGDVWQKHKTKKTKHSRKVDGIV